VGAGDDTRRRPHHRSLTIHGPAATSGGVPEIAVLPATASLDRCGPVRLGAVVFRTSVIRPLLLSGKQVFQSRSTTQDGLATAAATTESLALVAAWWIWTVGCQRQIRWVQPELDQRYLEVFHGL